MDNDFLFHSLHHDHLRLIHRWFNLPHIQAFYSLRNWTYEEVIAKLKPTLQHEKGIHAFMVSLGGKEIGYIQNYPIKEHPWEGQELPSEVVEKGAGIDFFIGEQEMLQKKLSSKIVRAFLQEKIFPFYDYVVVDPEVENIKSIRLFQSVGFKKIQRLELPNRLGDMRAYELMLISKNH